MRDRALLVIELVRNPRPDSALIAELAEHGRDCDRHLAIVSKSDVLVVLRQFRENALSASDIEAWACRLEGREDVGFEFGEEGVVKEVISWLANPDANQPIDFLLCQQIEIMFERRCARRDTP
jgi:hypothetical protein